MIYSRPLSDLPVSYLLKRRGLPVKDNLPVKSCPAVRQAGQLAEKKNLPPDCGPGDPPTAEDYKNCNISRSRAPQALGKRGKGKGREGGEKRKKEKREKRGGLEQHFCFILATNPIIIMEVM